MEGWLDGGEEGRHPMQTLAAQTASISSHYYKHLNGIAAPLSRT